MVRQRGARWANAWCWAFVLLAATGCDSTKHAMEGAGIGPRLADRALDQGEGRVRLNVKPGYYSSVDISSEPKVTIGMVLEQSNPHEKWAPMESVCVLGDPVAEPSGRKVCLNMVMPEPGSKRFLLRVQIRTKDEKQESYLKELDGDFVLGKEVRVSTLIGPSTVQFEVDGKAMTQQPIPLKADKIQLGCSSAECIFTIL